MLKYCYRKWERNREKLEERLRSDPKLLVNGNYEDFLKITIATIFNDDDESYGDFTWDTDAITTIDNGDYQGTLLFVIPLDTYQPSEYEYLMTYAGYGSCSGCDFLQSIQPWDAEDISDKTIENFMSLCLNFVQNMIRPYNHGWRHSDEFEHVNMKGEA